MKSVRCRACGRAHAEAVTCYDCQHLWFDMRDIARCDAGGNTLAVCAAFEPRLGVEIVKERKGEFPSMANAPRQTLSLPARRADGE